MKLFDASVLIAAFSPEQHSAQARALVASEPVIAVNVLGLAETRVSLIRKRKRGLLTHDETVQVLAALQRAIDDGLLRIVGDPAAVWEVAVSIADRTPVHLRTQDAYHAASALLGGYALVTFDADLAVAARGESVSVLP